VKTAVTHIPPVIDAHCSTAQLTKPWMRWAVFFFLLGSLFGLLMRYALVGTLPESIDYKNILHAHSHAALLGWGYLLVSGAMVFFYIKEKARLKTYKTLLIITVIANIGMALSFPVQGYGLYSIIFSTLHLLVSYFFAFNLFRDLRKSEPGLDIQFVSWALIWMMISTIGLWAIAPVGSVLGKTHPLYHLSVQWFLHFQLNGWFVYGMLGILTFWLKQEKVFIQKANGKLFLFHLSLVLTFSSTVFTSTGWPVLYYFNLLGVILQAYVYLWILQPAFKFILINSPKNQNWIKRLILLGLISLSAKAFVQLLMIYGPALDVSHHIRNLVVGFIHLVLLGAITFGIRGIALKERILPNNAMAKIGWALLGLGFVISELLLFVEGGLNWTKLGSIPFYLDLIFYASAFFPIGLGMIFVSFWVEKTADLTVFCPILKPKSLIS
jgi:hypothetical protein